jgi:rhodanese-related sulfurtransferase
MSIIDSSTSITITELSSQLGSPGAPLLLDVRREERFIEHPRMIASALRVKPQDIESSRLPQRDRPIVVYCVHGHEVGQDAAQMLRNRGFDARYLEGGIAAWDDAHLPTLRVTNARVHAGGSRWVTRERPKIDRIACPWLVRRFIDPLAQFEYVPPEQVVSHADAHGAIAYDVPGVQFTHRGEQCSFDALMADFDLQDPALARLALIVRGADTDRLDAAPQCAGLLAVSLGLVALHSDDHVLLEHGMQLYDALYAWCKQAAPERHGWNFPS